MARVHIVELLCESSPGVTVTKGSVRYAAASTEQLIGKVYAALQMLAALNPNCLAFAEFPTDTDQWIQLRCITDYTLLAAWQSKEGQEPDFPDHDASSSPW